MPSFASRDLMFALAPDPSGPLGYEATECTNCTKCTNKTSKSARLADDGDLATLQAQLLAAL